jgi:Ca-activated chloride channel family protein
VRITLPTVVASRYGNPAAVIAAHQVPHADGRVEYPTRFSLVLKGALARGLVTSPTHALVTGGHDGIMRLTAEPGLTLDRDIVVLVDGLDADSQAVVARDGEHYVAAASLVMPESREAARMPRAVKILLDCSGSMAGHKMAQARDAVLAVLANLSSQDYVSLTCFGSHVEARTSGLQRATTVTRARLGLMARTLNANLGGTEMEAGLDAATAIPVPDGYRSDVLMITDGEIWGVTSLIERVRSANHRLFVLALGMSSNEPLARTVSRDSRGACEFVTLNEDSRTAMHRILGRMRDPARTVGAMRWPAATRWTLGSGQAAFPGDALQVMAGFGQVPVGAVAVSVAGESTPIETGCALPVTVMEGDTLCRLAAAQRIATLPADQAAELAVRYQLVTKHTSCYVVATREAGAESLGAPALRTVPQMAAAGHAGWGGGHPGIGELFCKDTLGGRLDVAESQGWDATAGVKLRGAPRSPPPQSPAMDLPPTRWTMAYSPPAPTPALRHDVVVPLLRRLAEPGPLPTTLLELVTLGIEPETMEALGRLIDRGHAEADVVLAWLAVILRPDNAAVDARLLRKIQSGANLALVEAVRQELSPRAA